MAEITENIVKGEIRHYCSLCLSKYIVIRYIEMNRKQYVYLHVKDTSCSDRAGHDTQLERINHNCIGGT